MSEDFFNKELLGKFEDEQVFFKGTSKSQIDSSKKAALNRRGNELMNSGAIEDARRIFITTGYSDGISRVGDYYRNKGRLVDALRMYWTAHNKHKADELCMELSIFIKGLLKEKRTLNGAAND